MIEKEQNTSNPDISKTLARELGPADESRYESARWWRNLNRGMAVLGVLIIAVIVRLPSHRSSDVEAKTDPVLRLFWRLLVLSKAGQNKPQCHSHERSGVTLYYHVLRNSCTTPLHVACITSQTPMTSMIFFCQILRFVRVGRLDTPSRENLNVTLCQLTAPTCYHASSHLALLQ
jgi:hypothetical protein